MTTAQYNFHLLQGACSSPVVCRAPLFLPCSLQGYRAATAAAWQWNMNASPMILALPEVVTCDGQIAGSRFWPNEPERPRTEDRVLAERTHGIETDAKQPQAAWSVRRVTSPRPANSSGTEMSSSISSQCRPTRVSSTRARCAGLASRRRGKHASGTPSVRPSLSSTHIVCSSKCTDMAERSTRALSAAPRGAAAGVAFQAGAVAHQGEIAAFAAGFAFVALGLGLGALLGRRPRVRCARPSGMAKALLLLELLRRAKASARAPP